MQMLIERGNNVKLKLDLEEITVQNKQLSQEVTSLQEQLLVLAGKVESLEQNNSRMTLEIEKLTSEAKVKLSEEEKLRRELGDLGVKDATLNDQIKVSWLINHSNPMNLLINFTSGNIPLSFTMISISDICMTSHKYLGTSQL